MFKVEIATKSFLRIVTTIPIYIYHLYSMCINKNNTIEVEVNIEKPHSVFMLKKIILHNLEKKTFSYNYGKKHNNTGIAKCLILHNMYHCTILGTCLYIHYKDKKDLCYRYQ